MQKKSLRQLLNLAGRRVLFKHEGRQYQGWVTQLIEYEYEDWEEIGSLVYEIDIPHIGEEGEIEVLTIELPISDYSEAGDFIAIDVEIV